MKSILKISKERISNTFLSLNLGEVVMKKLNVFELKQVSGGDSGEVKHISDLIAPAPRDFVISLEEFERSMRDAGRVRIPEDPGMYI